MNGEVESYGVTLLSGGLDSTTVTAQARNQVQMLTAVTFHYGQTHSREVVSAGEVADILGVPHKLVDIGSFSELAWYSSLTTPERFETPVGRCLHQRSVDPGTGDDIPITYVPLRNTLFLAMAAALLESMALHAIESEGVHPGRLRATIFLAANAIDYSGYPDCRPEYFEKMREALNHGSKLWSQYAVAMQVETPIIHMSKAEIVALGMELEAPLAQSWSCYSNGLGADGRPCGGCDSCRLRVKGFAEAGFPDPLLARFGGASA